MIKVDFHTHTTAVDGFSDCEKMVKEAKKRGLDAIAIVDHNVITAIPDCDFPLIRGIEITTTVGHIIGLFLKDGEGENIYEQTPMEPLDAIDYIHRHGGYAIMAHPFEFRDKTESDFEGLPLDFIETANGRTEHRVFGSNKRSDALADKMGLPKTGGSDAHTARELNECITLVDCDSIDGLEKAFAEGKTTPVINRYCTNFSRGVLGFGYIKRTNGIKKKLKVFFRSLKACIFGGMMDVYYKLCYKNG